MGVNTDGRREVLGMEIGTSEAEAIWTEFLRKLTGGACAGSKLVVSDAHEGIKAAVSKALSATWQRCRVHFMRNAWPMPEERTACRVRLHCHGVCPGRRDGKRSMAQRRRAE